MATQHAHTPGSQPASFIGVAEYAATCVIIGYATLLLPGVRSCSGYFDGPKGVPETFLWVSLHHE